jgi:hypothetical protein
VDQVVVVVVQAAAAVVAMTDVNNNINCKIFENHFIDFCYILAGSYGIQNNGRGGNMPGRSQSGGGGRNLSLSTQHAD